MTPLTLSGYAWLLFTIHSSLRLLNMLSIQHACIPHAADQDKLISFMGDVRQRLTITAVAWFWLLYLVAP